MEKVKIELKKFGEYLISRPAGREAFLAMMAYSFNGGELKSNEVEVDFEGVKVLAPSWADEVITPLAQKYPVKLLNTKNLSVEMTLETLRKYSGLKV